MKPFLTLIISLTFIVTAFGQSDSARPDESSGQGFTNKAEATNTKVGGVKDGKWCEEEDGVMGKFYTLVIYKAGKMNGIARKYDEKGNLRIETPYTEGVENGVEKIYSDHGKVQYEIPFAAGKENGVEKIYGERGNVLYEIPFKNDKVDGIEKIYYANGGLLYEIPYKNGGIDGLEKAYGGNGKVKSETAYSSGKPGTVTTYDENGNVVKK